MKIVYSYYVMDVVHRGHLAQMQNAKALAGKNGVSIVGILTSNAVMEKKPSPAMSFDERCEIARSIKFNDVVIPQEVYSPIPNVLSLLPDIVCESTSHKEKDIEELKNSTKARIVVFPYYPNQSSTKIKDEIVKKKRGFN